MRIPLRTKVTLTLVAFGLIPAGIVAAFAYLSAQDLMGRQTVMIRQAAASISDHAKMLVLKNNELEHKGEKGLAENPPPLKWELSDADRDDLQRHISYTLRDHNSANASVYLVDPMNNLVLQRSNTGTYTTGGKLLSKYETIADLATGKMGIQPIEARSEPYEAAEIDGASAWRQFWDLTLPFLKPVIAIALLLRIMDALRLFDLVFILTQGGPADATKVLSFYIYQVAFRFVDIGYAAAISLVVLVLTVVFSTWFIKRMRLAV